MNQTDFSYLKNCFCRLRGALKATVIARKQTGEFPEFTEDQFAELVTIGDEIEELLAESFRPDFCVCKAKHEQAEPGRNEQ